MGNTIEIHRPSELKGAFDADEHALRDKIYEADFPQSFKMDYSWLYIPYCLCSFSSWL